MTQKGYKITMYLGHGHIIPQSKVGNTYLPDELFIDTVLHLPVPPPPMDSHLYELSMDRPTSIDLQPFLFPGSFDVKFGANLSQGELEIVQGLDTKVFRDANMQRIGAYKVERVIDTLRADSKSGHIEYAACVNMLSEKIVSEYQNQRRIAATEEKEVPSLAEAPKNSKHKTYARMWIAVMGV